MTLELNEVQFMKMAIDNSDPFCTVKEAQQVVYTTTQKIDDLNKQLIIDESSLKSLEDRDNMITKLLEKLNHYSDKG